MHKMLHKTAYIIYINDKNEKNPKKLLHNYCSGVIICAYKFIGLAFCGPDRFGSSPMILLEDKKWIRNQSKR